MCKTNTENCSMEASNAISVKRSLFGPVDHDEVSDFFKEEMEKLYRKKELKWEFNFRDEKPLENAVRFDWQVVDSLKATTMDSRIDIEVEDIEQPVTNALKNLDVVSERILDAQEILSRCKQSTMNDYWKCTKKRPCSIINNMMNKVDNKKCADKSLNNDKQPPEKLRKPTAT